MFIPIRNSLGMVPVSSELAERSVRVRRILTNLKKLYPRVGCTLRHRTPWELVVAVILSAQCTDKKVNEVTERLFKKYRNLDDYLQAQPRDFERDIYSTGFFRNKAKNILAAAQMIHERFNGT
jgi:endonuclease-3